MQPTQVSSTTTATPPAVSLLPSGAHRARLRRWRYLKDKMSKYGIAFAGGSVVFAFATIFVYLFSEVGPIFSSASVEKQQSYPSLDATPLLVNLERYGEVGLVVNPQGKLQFFNAQTGENQQQLQLPLPEDASITSFAKGEPRSGIIAVGLSNGQVVVAKHEYNLSYPNDKRQIVPVVT
ncbi:MAG: phosphate ABC transporter permease, partial [Gammaproteobacteria bacterium]|nr:phosphate ABC transporter permease [Gammaproteobacteria bacterium]MBU2278412.1 phosphate ABC transporter permease [Gammaproteobacteria bacterium]